MEDNPELQKIIRMVQQHDTHKRIQASDELKSYLNNPLNPLAVEAIDCLVDNLKSWISSSNYKISAHGLELLALVTKKGGKSVKFHLNSVIPITIDRLGDSKSMVRDNAHQFLLELVNLLSPQFPRNSNSKLKLCYQGEWEPGTFLLHVVLDMLIPGFSHKGWKVREEVMVCLMNTINMCGVSQLSVSKFTPHICKLLGDANSQVRDCAIRTLVEIYRHVGEKLRVDINKKGIPPTRLTLINSKFDEVARSGNMVATSVTDGPAKVNGETSDAIKVRPSSSQTLKRSSSRNDARSEGSTTAGLAVGAVDENDFIRAFGDIPTVQITSAKELADELAKIVIDLSKPTDDWEDHVAALKRVRSLVDGGSLDYDFPAQLKQLEGVFNMAVKSLRSAVAKEACVTLSYLSTKIGNKFGHFADSVLPTVIDLNANTATKIMASSGDTCAKIIIKHTHYPRLIPHITTRMTSRSIPVRIRCADYACLLLEYWELHYLKSHVKELEDVVRNGLSDASSEVRVIIRRLFWQFSKIFKDKADRLFNTLDSSKQKLLEDDKKNRGDAVCGVPQERRPKTPTRTRNSGSSNGQSVSSRPTRTEVTTSKPTRTNSKEDTTSRHIPAPSPSRRTLSATSTAGTSRATTPGKMMGRSISSIDTRAAERARERRRSRTAGVSPGTNQQRPSRPAAKVVHRGYMSQPSSRSTSPSRLNHVPVAKERSDVYSKLHSPMKSKIPTPNSRSASRSSSRASSRDPSPTRDHGTRTLSSSSTGRKGPHVRRLDAKDFTEAAVWDALSKSPRPRNYSVNSANSEDMEDGGSDTSSIHSDRSSSSITSSMEFSETIALCNSTVWSERRDGLIAIQSYTRSARTLNHPEVLHCLECFNRLFYDPNNKVFSAFLDTLSEFVVVHKAELNEWLFILLTRLLSKLGSDPLASVQSKIVRTLDVIRETFPFDIQFSVLTRFITDNKQIPNAKVRIAILHYLQGLIVLMDPAEFVNSSETRLTVSRFLTWTSDPKSAEVRKEAATVIVALFELNTPIFSSMLPHFPKSFHDGASKLIRNHLKKVNSDVKLLTANNSYHEADVNPPNPPGRLGYRSIPSPGMNRQSSNDQEDDVDASSHEITELSRRISQSDLFNRENSATSLRSNDSAESLEGAKMTTGKPEGLDNSPSISSSGYHSDELHTLNTSVPANEEKSPTRPSNTLLPSNPVASPSSSNSQAYDPKQYQDESNDQPSIPKSPLNGIAVKPDMSTVIDSPDVLNKGTQDDAEAIHQLLRLLSDPSSDVKRDALTDLMNMARKSSPSLWENQFKDILMSVVEKMKDPEPSIRTLAVRVVRDMVNAQPYSFNELNGVVISEVLQLHQDTEKGVVRAAEEAAVTFSKAISPDECMTVLSPLISNADYPVNLAGIKMLTKALEDVDQTTVEINLSLLVPPLLKCYDDTESSVRKASVFCLVAIHNIVGEAVVRPYLQELPATKMKLLNLYIKRSQSSNGTEV